MMPRRLFMILAVLLPAVTTPAGAERLTDFTAGDSDELRQAMSDVGPGDSRRILLDGGRYDFEASGESRAFCESPILPEVKGSISIVGHGSTMTGTRDARGLFCLAKGATLQLRDVIIEGFGQDPTRHRSVTVASNAGHLLLDGVVIRNTGALGAPGSNPGSSMTIFNSGRLEIYDSEFSENRAADRPTGNTSVYTPPRWSGILVNRGEMLVRDSVFINNQARTHPEDHPSEEWSPAAVMVLTGASHLLNVTVSGNSHGIRVHAESALIEHSTIADNGYGIQNGWPAVIRNSIIARNGPRADCLNAPSLGVEKRFEGVNLDSDGSCGFDPNTSLVNTDPRLGPLVRLENGLSGHIPERGSPVLDRGPAAFCSNRDAAGYLRNTAADRNPRCALGALERPNEPPDFEIDARLTGTWYDPQHDGHYLTFQVLPVDLVAAAWWTYDADGDQVWLIGSGQVKGDTATVDVYASRGMTLPALDTAQREETLWGTLELEFPNCNEMELRWETDRPGFGDGTATLTRLTVIEGLAC